MCDIAEPTVRCASPWATVRHTLSGVTPNHRGRSKARRLNCCVSNTARRIWRDKLASPNSAVSSGPDLQCVLCNDLANHFPDDACRESCAAQETSGRNRPGAAGSENRAGVNAHRLCYSPALRRLFRGSVGRGCWCGDAVALWTPNVNKAAARAVEAAACSVAIAFGAS